MLSGLLGRGGCPRAVAGGDRAATRVRPSRGNPPAAGAFVGAPAEAPAPTAFPEDEDRTPDVAGP